MADVRSLAIGLVLGVTGLACSISSGADTLRNAPMAATFDAQQVLVRFNADATPAQVDAALAKAGVLETVRTYSLVPGLRCVRVPLGQLDQSIAALAADPAVMYAERDHIVWTCEQTTPYGIPMVNAPAVWPTSQGAGATVAVLDTGVDTQHPDLPVPVLTTSFIPGQSVEDLNTHGTHCSGTVLALNNTIGVVGCAPEASLMIGKVLSNGGSGATSGVIAGVDWAVANGADVISMSLGGGGFNQAFLDSCNAAVAANVLVVAAAGNDNVGTPHYPSSYPSVVSVMAMDSNRQKASFSNFGPDVDIGAPGVSVNSTVPIITSNALWNSVNHAAGILTGSAFGTVNGAAIYCGYGASAAEFPPSVSGNIAHVRRGSSDGSTVTFRTKAENAFAAGAIGVIISNNAGGVFGGTLNINMSIPVISISQTDGNELQSISGVNTTISIARTGSGYGTKSGTSMACPHVAGVAGLLVGAFHPQTVPVSLLRTALETTAEDLGDPGRDDIFGHGLVNAGAAYTYILNNLPSGCGSADFDGDGDVGTDADIEAFFACLGGNCCATCGSADFDGDGDVGTDADIEAFFAVLGGGAC